MNVVDSAGPEAARIASLTWFFIGVSGAIYGAVASVTLAAVLWRKRRRPDDAALARRVWPAVIAMGIVLFVLMGASFSTGSAIHAPASDGALRIEIVARQWWWEVIYPDALPAKRVTTANEIHVPVGRQILIEGTSLDVIHSFWVPNVAGK